MPRIHNSDPKPLEIAIDIGENEKDPAEFRDCVILAEKLGYDAVWLGDHFMPWVHSGNKSAYVWSLMGSCLEATKKIKLGPYVTTPIGARYHPAIIAQASATLDNMYPGRLLLGVGTGEAINEVPFFQGWPPWEERMGRLIEGTQLIRRLWKAESYFDFSGKYFRLNQVFLYTKPKTEMKIYISGVGVKAAGYAGEFGDGLITLSSHNSFEKCRDVVFPSFTEGVRRAGKHLSEEKIILSLSFTLKDRRSYLETERTYAGLYGKSPWNQSDPRKVEQAGREMKDEDILRATHFCQKWSDVVDLISKYQEIGVNQVVLPPGADRKQIKTYAEKILPQFRKERRT
jgi:coenzyme F420-dependent glucose-6-phosphate dehydrogenase